MKTHIGVYGYICIQLLLGFSALVQAQVDPTKVLVGRWEGVVATGQNNGRTIIFKSVSPKDNGWVAEGFYAIAENQGRGRRMTFEVSRQGGDIIVEFVSGRNNPARLKLLDERHLEGTMNFVAAAGRNVNTYIKLEKVEPKKEEPK